MPKKREQGDTAGTATRCLAMQRLWRGARADGGTRKAGTSQMHARAEPSMQQANTNLRLHPGPTPTAVHWMLSRATVAGDAHAPVTARGEMAPKIEKIKKI